MKSLFSIGELARYQKISKQTLIFYDKIGLFRPAWVDPDNGYRYYSASQMDDLDTILMMKKIGFSLSEIRAHMENYDLESSLALFRGQLEVIDQKIQELRMIRSRVQNRCSQMESALARCRQDQEIQLEQAGEQALYCCPVAPPYSLQEISIATKACFTGAFEEKLPVLFQCGVIVPLERIQAGRYTEASDAFLPMEGPCQNPRVKRVEPGKRACIYHVGDYLSIGRSYRRLLDWCRQQGLRIVSDSYEFCINDYLTSGDQNEYITKIAFYVENQA